MLICNVSKVGELCSVLNGCKDNVELVMPNGSAYGWRENGDFVQSLLQALKVEHLNGVEVKTRNSADASLLMDFLMQS